MAMKVLVLLLTTICAALAAELSATFTLFDNGGSGAGKQVTINRSRFVDQFSFARKMSLKIRVSKQGAARPVIADRAFREDGVQIVEFSQLVSPEGAAPYRIYLVPSGLPFQWPFVSAGHRQAVSPEVVQPLHEGESVTLVSISDSPRVFSVEGLFDSADAQALIKSALTVSDPEKKLKRSYVGAEGRSDLRTGEAALDMGESQVARKVISRSFQLVREKENFKRLDGVEILRYEETQGYDYHYDFYPESVDTNSNFVPAFGGTNVFATVRLYVGQPELGGATLFTRGTRTEAPTEIPKKYLAQFGESTWEHNITKQCTTGLAVRPQVGRALLFYSVTAAGLADALSEHAVCPVLRGALWTADVRLWSGPRYDRAGDLHRGAPSDTAAKQDKQADSSSSQQWTPLLVTFVNDLDEVVELVYNNDVFETMDPGKVIAYNTYATQVWTARSKSTGKTLWSFLVKEKHHNSKQRISKKSPGFNKEDL